MSPNTRSGVIARHVEAGSPVTAARLLAIPYALDVPRPKRAVSYAA